MAPVCRFLVSPAGAAGLVLAAAVLAPARLLAYGRCIVDTPVQAMYPTVTTSRVPRNASFLLAVDGVIDGELAWSNSHLVQPLAVQGIGRFSFDVSAFLTPGSHEALFAMSPNDGNALPVEPDSFELRFEVDADPAPLPDETTSVRITRVASYVRKYGYVYRGLDEAIASVLADPADCSRHVAAQTSWCRTAPGPAPRLGDYHVEFEVEGPALGFSINDRFLPSHCRSAFFDASELEIQAITETGLGTPQAFLGDIEVGVADEGPASALFDSPRKSWADCGLAPPRPTSPWHTILGAALFASACFARRRAGAVAAAHHR